MTTALSVDNLYQLSDEQVQGQVQTVFGSQLQTAPAVQSTFFPGATPPPVAPVLPGWVNNVAVAMTCSSIARSSLYGFSGTVNMNAADQYWQTQLNGAQGIQTNNALYDWAFPSYCQGDGQTFANYLNQNAASWGEQLVEMVTNAAFLNTFATKIISASPNWPQQLNLIFYKIKRLAPDQLASVIQTYQKSFPEQGITVSGQQPVCLIPALYTADQYLSQVNTAISKPSVQAFTTMGGFEPITTVATTYGENVMNFLTGPAASIGLYTGQRPNNFSETCY